MANSPAYDRIKNLLSDKKADVKKYLKKDYQSADELVNLASQLSPLQQAAPGFAGGQDKLTPVDARGVQTELAEAIAAYNRAFDSMTRAIESAFKRETRNIRQDIRALSEQGGHVAVATNRNGQLLSSIATAFSLLDRETTVAYTNLGATLNIATDRSRRFAGIRAPAAAGAIGNTIPDLRALEQATIDLMNARDFYALFVQYRDLRTTYLHQIAEALISRPSGTLQNAPSLDKLMGAYGVIAATCTHFGYLLELFENLPTARAKSEISAMKIRMEEIYDELKKIAAETIDSSLTKVPYAGGALPHGVTLETQRDAINGLPRGNFANTTDIVTNFTTLSELLIDAMDPAAPAILGALGAKATAEATKTSIETLLILPGLIP